MRNIYMVNNIKMTSRKIVAIGGGENWMVKPDWTKKPYETEWIDAEIVKLTGKEHPNFLFYDTELI